MRFQVSRLLWLLCSLHGRIESILSSPLCGYQDRVPQGSTMSPHWTEQAPSLAQGCMTLAWGHITHIGLAL